MIVQTRLWIILQTANYPTFVVPFSRIMDVMRRVLNSLPMLLQTIKVSKRVFLQGDPSQSNAGRLRAAVLPENVM